MLILVRRSFPSFLAKTSIFLASIFVASISMTPAQAVAESEISFYGGLNNFTGSNGGQSVSLPNGTDQSSYGLRYTNWLLQNWGVALDYQNLSLENGVQFSNQTLSVNGLRRFDNIPYLSPYLGIGVGIATDQATNEAGLSNAADWGETGLVTSGIIGTQIPITEQISLFGEVKFDYMGASDNTQSLFDQPVTDSLNQSINFGVSLSF